VHGRRRDATYRSSRATSHSILHDLLLYVTIPRPSLIPRRLDLLRFDHRELDFTSTGQTDYRLRGMVTAEFVVPIISMLEILMKIANFLTSKSAILRLRNLRFKILMIF